MNWQSEEQADRQHVEAECDGCEAKLLDPFNGSEWFDNGWGYYCPQCVADGVHELEDLEPVSGVHLIGALS